MADAYVAECESDPSLVLEPTAEQVKEIEEDIAHEIYHSVLNSTIGKLLRFTVPLGIPSGCDPWHMFNYLHRKGYDVSFETFFTRPVVGVNLRTSMGPAIVEARSRIAKYNNDLRKRSDDFFSNKKNFVGAIEYRDEEVLLVFKTYTAQGTYERMQLMEDLGESVKVGNWGGGKLWIAVPPGHQYAWKTKEVKFTQVLTHYMEHRKEYNLQLSKPDRAIFDEFCATSYGLADSWSKKSRCIPFKLSGQGAFIAECYGFGPYTFNQKTQLDDLLSLSVGNSYMGKHDRIVEPTMITATVFFDHFAVARRQQADADNDERKAKRQKVLDVYDNNTPVSRHLSSGSIVHIFRYPIDMAIEALPSADQKRVAERIEQCIAEKGVKCTCQVSQKSDGFAVMYTRVSRDE